jgi:hypothetical protein
LTTKIRPVWQHPNTCRMADLGKQLLSLLRVKKPRFEQQGDVLNVKFMGLTDVLARDIEGRIGNDRRGQCLTRRKKIQLLLTNTRNQIAFHHLDPAPLQNASNGALSRTRLPNGLGDTFDGAQLLGDPLWRLVKSSLIRVFVGLAHPMILETVMTSPGLFSRFHRCAHQIDASEQEVGHLILRPTFQRPIPINAGLLGEHRQNRGDGSLVPGVHPVLWWRGAEHTLNAIEAFICGLFGAGRNPRKDDRANQPAELDV